MSYIFQDGQIKNLEIVRDNDGDHLTGIAGRCPAVRSARKRWTFPHVKTAKRSIITCIKRLEHTKTDDKKSSVKIICLYS